MGSNLIDGKLNVKDELTNVISKLGENIVINRLFYLKDPNFFFQKYVHNSVNPISGNIGVLLVYNSNKKNEIIDEFSKNICMHIAATEPKSIDISGLDEKIIEKEKQIYSEQLKNSGKPEEIIDKIVSGKIKKFYEEVCFTEQRYIKDDDKKIKEMILEFEKQNGNFKPIKYQMYIYILDI